MFIVQSGILKRNKISRFQEFYFQVLDIANE